MNIEDIIEEKYTNWLNCETDELDLTIEEAKHILVNDHKQRYVDDLLEESWKIVLSELEKKDKVINEMSNFINLMSNELVAETGDNNLEFCKMQKCIDNGELDCEECIKQYFIKKATDNVGE